MKNERRKNVREKNESKRVEILLGV